jgi:hypothetical protein
LKNSGGVGLDEAEAAEASVVLVLVLLLSLWGIPFMCVC